MNEKACAQVPRQRHPTTRYGRLAVVSFQEANLNKNHMDCTPRVLQWPERKRKQKAANAQVVCSKDKYPVDSLGTLRCGSDVENPHCHKALVAKFVIKALVTEAVQCRNCLRRTTASPENPDKIRLPRLSLLRNPRLSMWPNPSRMLGMLLVTSLPQ